MKTRKVVVLIKQSNTKESKDYEFKFSYPECRLSFNCSQTDKEEAEKCAISVSGISRDTYMMFDSKANSGYLKNQRAEVYYGYDDDLSLVFSGVVERVRYDFADGAQNMIVGITKNNRKFNEAVKNVSLTGKMTLREAIENICMQYGYKYVADNTMFDSFEIGRYSDTTTLREALRQIIPSSFGYYIREDEIFFFHKDKSIPKEIVIYGESGLITYPVEDSSGKHTTIKTVLLPFCEVGLKVKIPVDEKWFSKEDTGNYRTFVVKSYSTNFSNGLGTTEMECEGGDGF
ncbi:MAG: hypothetical protein ACRC0G_14655 [Fusobacteriaceae bacterium]